MRSFGLTFQVPKDFTLWEASQGEFTVQLTYEGGATAQLRVSTGPPGVVSMEFLPQARSEYAAYFKVGYTTHADAFYGLGAFHDHVDHKGRVRPMALEPDPDSESKYIEAHVRIPFVFGTNGVGLFIESDLPMVFDVASKAEDRVVATVGAGPFAREGLAFHLLFADHPLDVPKLYYELTGYPGKVAAWALGPWVWRDKVENHTQVEQDLQTMRDMDLACTGYWIDRPYASAVNSFDFEPVKFKEPDKMFELARRLGFKVALWHSPYLEPLDPDSAPLYEYAQEHGFFPPLHGPGTKWGPPLDFTNPNAVEWWQEELGYYIGLGVVGYKLDYAEDVVLGLLGVRNEWRFHDGSDERTMHHRYQEFYHRTYAQLLPDDGGFLLCRTGVFGDQKNGVILWPGDLDARFWEAGHPIEKGNGTTERAVGGFKASIVYGLSASVSGYPFFGADTGGYKHSPPDKELFTRWFEQTALSTVMQVGNSASTVPWEFSSKTGYDEEMLGWYRFYARLHLRLWPYVWTYVQRMAKDGRPIARPFGVQHPELGEHPDFLYFLGDDLLVAPVVERGARKRTVIFPPGVWYDFFGGATYEGPDEVEVDAPLYILPLFVREGALVPLLRPTIDTLVPTDVPEEVDSFATDKGVLWVLVAPGQQGAFEVYDGTRLEQSKGPNEFRLRYEQGTDFTQGVVFDAIGLGKPPKEVRIDGELAAQVGQDAIEHVAGPAFAYVEDKGGELFLRLPAGGHEAVVVF